MILLLRAWCCFTINSIKTFFFYHFIYCDEYFLTDPFLSAFHGCRGKGKNFGRNDGEGTLRDAVSWRGNDPARSAEESQVSLRRSWNSLLENCSIQRGGSLSRPEDSRLSQRDIRRRNRDY